MGLQPDVVNQRLIADAGDDKFAATTGTSVPAALIPTITGNPAVKARVATSPSGALQYLAMNTKRPALANAERPQGDPVRRRQAGRPGRRGRSGVSAVRSRPR